MIAWKELHWLVLDCETTGLDPAADRIIELAAVTMKDGEVVRRNAQLLDPGIPIPAEATAVHGIADEHVAGKPGLADIAPKVCQIVGVAPLLVAYNWPFDRDFLLAGCPGFAAAIDGLAVLDPLTVVRLDDVGRYWKGAGRHKLANVCEKMKLPIPGNAHRASADAIMAGLVLWRFRNRLSDDLAEAAAFLEDAGAKQEADFQAWLAQQPAREAPR